MKLPSVLVLLIGLIVGILPGRAKEGDIELGNARFIQKVSSKSATFVHATESTGDKIKQPVECAFYVGIEAPVPFKEGELVPFSKPKLKESRLSDEEVGKMLMMEAGAYLVLLDGERKPVALLSDHGGGVISISKVVKVGTDVFQNDPESVSDSYHRISFPSVVSPVGGTGGPLKAKATE